VRDTFGCSTKRASNCHNEEIPSNTAKEAYQSVKKNSRRNENDEPEEKQDPEAIPTMLWKT